MNYKIEFQYKKPDSPVPEARVQDAEIRFDSSQFLLLPDVGDTVTYAYDQHPVARKVITRHFSFIAAETPRQIRLAERRPAADFSHRPGAGNEPGSIVIRRTVTGLGA